MEGWGGEQGACKRYLFRIIECTEWPSKTSDLHSIVRPSRPGNGHAKPATFSLPF